MCGRYGRNGRIYTGLPTTLPIEDESALRFDLLTMQLQLAFIEGLSKFNKLRDNIIHLASQLENKTNIPMVAEHIELITTLQQEKFWSHISLLSIDDFRQNLRDLIQFIDLGQRIDIYTDFSDEIGQMREVQAEYGSSGVNILQYRKKVQQFIQQHQDQQVIRKIRFAMPLTSEDLQQLEEFFFEAADTGTKDDFENAYPGRNSLPDLIRGMVGLDRKAAKEAFSHYLDDKVFSADQIRFVNFIIDHLTQNGAIKESLLYEQPYTDFHEHGLDGMFPKEADKLIAILRNINGSISAEA